VVVGRPEWQEEIARAEDEEVEELCYERNTLSIVSYVYLTVNCCDIPSALLLL
jgi:hypothetical protein